MNKTNHPPRLTRALRRALGHIRAERLLERGTNANLGLLCVERERLLKVGELLAVVDDALADELEGQDAVLAVWLHGEGREDGALLDGGADADVVDSGADEHVVDVEGSDLGAVEVVAEGGVADLEGQDGGVGDVGEAVEVVALAEGDVGLGHLEALEAVDALELDGLLEGHLGGLEALDVHERLALDGHEEGRVPEVPRVEVDEGLEIGAGDLLGDVDEGQAGLGLGHLERHDGGVWELVLEVHSGVEAVDDGGDGVGRRDRGVDGHQDGVRLGVGDGDAVNAQGGVVDLVLDDAGEPDEDAGLLVRGMRARQMVRSWQLYNLQRKGNNEHANGEHDQERPPPLPAEAHEGASLGLLGMVEVVVLDLDLASVALIKTHGCSFISENGETVV
ncbi:hypothetical protein V498_04411 [Pseudogymnoascus sp. VKM F-4517 (FW-2822)]|nr:hypothetical protein V498_04411 [Pseudogymnoascus sp. VKM F-4517 (FW-2822)]